METIEFSTITPDIVHIKMSTKKELANALCRFQEHYESPFEEIKGKIFTLGQLRQLGSRENNGIWTYMGGNAHEPDWSGYNFPSYVLDPFFKGLFDPLTKYEQDIVEALRCKEGKYYVIGTFGDEDPDETLEHETCHAFFYLNDKYREQCIKAMDSYKKELEPLRKYLLEIGYSEDVLEDECHAYVSCDYEYVKENWHIELPVKLHKQLRAIRKRHFPDI